MKNSNDVKLSTIAINGINYIPEDSVVTNSMAPETEGMKFCVIRTKSAGVHVGYVYSRDKGEVTLVNSRRIWYWEGAMTLSEVAVTGITKPDSCKVACIVPEIILTEVIEIITCTAVAKKIIDNIKVFSK